MIIPNAANAVIDIRKLTDYCLNPRHMVGKNKARVLASKLALTAANAQELAEALLFAVRNDDAKIGRADKFGQRYIVDLVWERAGRKATIGAPG